MSEVPSGDSAFTQKTHTKRTCKHRKKQFSNAIVNLFVINTRAPKKSTKKSYFGKKVRFILSMEKQLLT
jgi:esterase/lipase superfamily enzyme